MTLDDIRKWHLEYAERWERNANALMPDVQAMVHDNANWHRRAASVCEQGHHANRPVYWECVQCGGTEFRSERGVMTRFCDDCGAEDNGDLPFGAEVIR